MTRGRIALSYSREPQGIMRRLREIERQLRELRAEIESLKDEFSYIRERLAELEAQLETRRAVSRARAPRRAYAEGEARRARRYSWIVELVREHGLLVPVAEGGRVILKDAYGRDVREVRKEELIEAAKGEVKVITDEDGKQWLVDPTLYERLLRRLPLPAAEAENVLTEKEKLLLELLNRAGIVLLQNGSYVPIEER